MISSGVTSQFNLTSIGRFSTSTDRNYDVRFAYCINQPDAEQQPDLYASSKYVLYTSAGGSDVDYTGNDTQGALIPVIRMSEIIMIMAECKARGYGEGSVAEAVSLLSKGVCEKRYRRSGTISADDFNGFMEKLDLEMWKENIGEGQYFFFLKRLNSPTLVSTTQTIQMAGKYVFDIPDSETTLK